MPHSAGRLAETRHMAFSGQRPPTGTVDDLCAKRTNWSAKYGCAALSVMAALALQLLFLKASESMGNHDSNIVDAGRVD